MDLHGQIMNIQVRRTEDGGPMGWSPAYLEGHRDARHAAAEIALRADACIDALRSLDSRLRACMSDPISAAEAYDSDYQELVAEALAALDGKAC